MITYIYTLIDPITKEVRYVGKSINPKNRYSQHIRSSVKRKTYVNIWVNDLINDGLKPIMEIVDKCVDCDWVELERSWAVKLYEENKKLCNLTYISEKENRDPNLSINITSHNKIIKSCEEIVWLKKNTDLSYENILNFYDKKEYIKCKKLTQQKYRDKKFSNKKYYNLMKLNKDIKDSLNDDLEFLVWYRIITEKTPKHIINNLGNVVKRYNKETTKLISKRGGIYYNQLYYKDDYVLDEVLLIINKIVEYLSDTP
jgi:hypothetical protein